MKEKKLGFFRRIKKAIFNFDEYSTFWNEKMSISIKYFLKLVLLSAIVSTVVTTYKTYKIAENTIERFKNESPEFSVINGILTIENNQKFEYIDDENYFGIVVDPTMEDITKIEYDEGIMFAKEKIVVRSNNTEKVISYKELVNKDLNKKDIENILTKENLKKAYAIIGIILFISNFFAYIIVLIINILIISMIGMMVNWIADAKLKYSNVFIISIYAITLSTILLMIYTVITSLTNFTIKYFNIAYNLISYIYAITVIFMAKSDLIKNKQELFVEEKKKKEEEQIKKEEKKEDKKEEKEDKEKRKKDKKNNEKAPGEPNANEA